MPIVVAVLGVIIVVLGVAFFLIPGPEANAPTTDLVTEEVNRTKEIEQAEEIEVVDDGTTDTPSTTLLKGESTYLTPARKEHKITVELTMTGDIVTDANVLYDDKETYGNPNHERFDNAYKTEVVGKSLSEISLSRVGGASLTSGAFNEAIKKMLEPQVL